MNKSDNQRMLRVFICSSYILRNIKDTFLDRIVTSDENWVICDNLDLNEPPRHLSKPKEHPETVTDGIIPRNFLKKGNKYCNELSEMHQKLSVIRPALINRNGPILLHDNARLQASLITVQKLNDLRYESIVLQVRPLYSPDFHFSHSLDNVKRFRKQEDIENAFKQFLSECTEYYGNYFKMCHFNGVTFFSN
ncbi:Histone-lysine N-methyltransferase SETMAR [Habropoda laboriosa]|uniref:Histone-lysine N-methyltransferase SETMAR n=1 Tax=Habropoda laboriosa TaxID=597456 RepID=A0A0L7QKB7_9HYME|nr:Histone-lysine N-methyltransferase SETMAR [Habropoda laboriosa]